MRRTQLTIFVLGAALALAIGVGVSYAQSPGAGNAKEFLRAGQDALANGKYQAAAGHFGKALRSNELSDAQVARALYLRGTAYQQGGRPAQAIADITSALYIPGLSSADRAKAYLSRGKAYEAVGMGSLAKSDIARARNGGVSERQVARSSAAPQSSGGNVPAFATSVEPSGARSTAPSFSTSVNSGRSRETVPTFATRAVSGSTRSSAPSFETQTTAPSASTKRKQTASLNRRTSRSDTQEDQIPQFRTSILPQENAPKKSPPAPNASPASAPPASGKQAAPEPEKQSGGRVSRFFGGIRSRVSRGDDKKQTAPAPAPAPTPPAASTTTRWNQTTREARAPQPSWDSQVSGPAQQARSAPQQRPAPRPIPQAAPASGAGGYRIQLAALKSDAEAQATWKRLQAKHGSLLGSYQPNIVRSELGGLGTFYRVQLGPFPDKASTQQLCKNFKAGGLDCFLLSQ